MKKQKEIYMSLKAITIDDDDEDHYNHRGCETCNIWYNMENDYDGPCPLWVATTEQYYCSNCVGDKNIDTSHIVECNNYNWCGNNINNNMTYFKGYCGKHCMIGSIYSDINRNGQPFRNWDAVVRELNSTFNS